MHLYIELQGTDTLTLEFQVLDHDLAQGWLEQFQPFNHYSADFVVRFSQLGPHELDTRRARMLSYYNQHREFFEHRGITSFDDVRLQPIKFPVAHLRNETPRAQLIAAIGQHPWINRVYIA